MLKIAKDLKHIISHVHEQLNLKGENIKNVNTDVRSGIALGLEYGIISGNRNAYKLAVNLDAKPKEIKVAAPKKAEASATSIIDEDGSDITVINFFFFSKLNIIFYCSIKFRIQIVFR